jgi:hypothetical protein
VSNRKVRITGLAITFATLAAGVIMSMPKVPARDRTQCCVDSTLLSFELAPAARDAQMVLVSDTAAARDEWSAMDPLRQDVIGRMRENLLEDSFLFAPAYTALFIYFALLIRTRDRRGLLSAIAICLALLTFIADEAENRSALTILGDGGAGTLARVNDANVAWMRGFSLTKWFLAGVTALALAALFWPRKHWPADVELLSFASAILLIAGSGFAIWGTLATALNPGVDSSIESSLTSTVLAFVPATVLLLAYPVWLQPPPAKR